jgi:translation initiation factor 2B subunit (eIF-2B alpha/beta/delta family)
MEQNRRSGASEIEMRVFSHLREGIASDRTDEAAREVLRLYPSMGAVWRAVNGAVRNPDHLAAIAEDMREVHRRVIDRATSVIGDGDTVLTFSRSATVSALLSANRHRGIAVLCGESRPGNEGRVLARDLAHAGIEITLATDASLFALLPRADRVIVGADAVTATAVVNKTGTAPLLACARERGIETYVVCSSFKAFPFVFIKDEPPDEVWGDAPPSVAVVNRYFDATPVAQVSFFVTEKETTRRPPRFDGTLTGLVRSVRDELREQHLLVE